MTHRDNFAQARSCARAARDCEIEVAVERDRDSIERASAGADERACRALVANRGNSRGTRTRDGAR